MENSSSFSFSTRRASVAGHHAPRAMHLLPRCVVLFFRRPATRWPTALALAACLLAPFAALAETSGPDRRHLAVEAAVAVGPEAEAEHPASVTHLHGMAVLQFKQTFESRGNFETLMLQFELEHQTRDFGFLINPRLRLADFEHLIGGSTLWVHQGYAFYTQAYGQFKLGKVMSVFGRVWDYGFYGPLLAQNDVKMAPDVGLTFEGTQKLKHNTALYYAAQYSPIDGRAVAVGHGQALRLRTRREHIAAVRLAPSYKPWPDLALTLGVSGQRFTAVQLGRHQVLRAEADVEASFRGLSGFVETGLQNGEDLAVSQNALITSHSYIWTGVEYAIGPASLRYHFNGIAYNDAQQTVEYLHQPGLALAAGPHCTFVAEMAFWQTSRVITGRGERTLYIFAGGAF